MTRFTAWMSGFRRAKVKARIDAAITAEMERAAIDHHRRDGAWPFVDDASYRVWADAPSTGPDDQWMKDNMPDRIRKSEGM